MSLNGLLGCVQRVVIYPAYINSNVTVAGGRRIPKDKGELHLSRCLIVRLSAQPCLGDESKPSSLPAGCKDPNVIEITDCCVGILKLKAEYEVRPGPCSFHPHCWIAHRLPAACQLQWDLI